MVVDGRRESVVSFEGTPIGPIWQAKFFLGADNNGRDLMVRLLYAGRTSVLIGACAVLLTLLLAAPLALAWHLLLPWVAAALPFAGIYVHVVRASLLDAASLDHVRTARAKGLSEKRLLRRHVLRNGLIPPVNIWGLDLSHALGGYALYVEVILGLPGVGLLTADTLAKFDLPPIIALAFYLSVVVVLAGAIVDIAIAYLDPRIRRPGLRT